MSFQKNGRDISPFVLYEGNDFDVLYNKVVNGQVKLIASPIAIQEMLHSTKLQTLLSNHYPHLQNIQDNNKFYAKKLKILHDELIGFFDYALEIVDLKTHNGLNFKNAIGELTYKYLNNGINKLDIYEINDLLLYAHASILGLPFLTNDHMFSYEDISKILQNTNFSCSSNPLFEIEHTKNTDLHAPVVFPSKINQYLKTAKYDNNRRFYELKKSNKIKNITENIHNQLQVDSLEIKEILSAKNNNCDEILEMLSNNIDFCQNLIDTDTSKNKKKLYNRLLFSSNKTRKTNHYLAVKFINKIEYYETLYHKPFEITDEFLNSEEMDGVKFKLIRTKSNKTIGFNLNGIDYVIPLDKRNQMHKADAKQKLNLSIHPEEITPDNFILYSFFPQSKEFSTLDFVTQCYNAKNDDLQQALTTKNNLMDVFSMCFANCKQDQNKIYKEYPNYLNFLNIERRQIERITIWQPRPNKQHYTREKN